MSFSCGPACVVLNQQREQGNYDQTQQEEDVPVSKTKNTSHKCTVVENGRVVVKELQPPTDETTE
jgi:hypothetical protein